MVQGITGRAWWGHTRNMEPLQCMAHTQWDGPSLVPRLETVHSTISIHWRDPGILQHNLNMAVQAPRDPTDYDSCVPIAGSAGTPGSHGLWFMCTYSWYSEILGRLLFMRTYSEIQRDFDLWHSNLKLMECDYAETKQEEVLCFLSLLHKCFKFLTRWWKTKACTTRPPS